MEKTFSGAFSIIDYRTDQKLILSDLVYSSADVYKLKYILPNSLNDFRKPLILHTFDSIYDLVILLTFIIPLTVRLKNIPHIGIDEYVSLY